jgi:hypothetical protein
MKYAIKIRLAMDDWIYITKDTGGRCWDLVPETFDTKDEAEKFAENWRKDFGDTRYVKVVEYSS